METLTSNKRIAKNTIMLYLRMMVGMIVSLYMSRIVLKTLGVSDYGIYGVVGGVVTMFSFFNGTMASATARFLSFEIGTGNMRKLKDTFSAALTLHVSIALLLVFLSEIIGLWFLENRLVIPEERMIAAHWVFQFSVFSMVFQIIQVPFNSTLISHERIGVYAFVEIFNSVIKLAVVYILLVVYMDKLILYSILMFLTAVLISGIYICYGIKNFRECSLKLKICPDIIKPILSMTGWQFYGNMSYIAVTQGINILLNMWYGTIINAAYDIASRVRGMVMSFSTNMNTAMRPQIVKSYSVKEFDRTMSLMCNGNRLTFILMLLLCAPLIIKAHYILDLWLGEVPMYSVAIMQLCLIWNLQMSMAISFGDVQQATADVKITSLITGTSNLLVVLITYIGFNYGAPYWFPFVLNILFMIPSPLYTCHNFKKFMPIFSWKKHVFRDYLRSYVIMLMVLVSAQVVSSRINSPFLSLLTVIVCTTILTCILGFYFLFPSPIRNKIIAIGKYRMKNVRIPVITKPSK